MEPRKHPGETMENTGDDGVRMRKVGSGYVNYDEHCMSVSFIVGLIGE